MATAKNKKSILSTILKLLYYIVIVFVCLIAIFLIYYIINSQLHADDENYKPKFSIYTIVSPSMTPVINVYDIVINIRPETPKDIQVGDIITYKSSAANTEGMTITHRVIGVSQLPDGTYEYMTQGDNNEEPDSLYVTYDNVIGKEIAIIPYLGRLQFLIANQKGWLFLLLIPVSIYLIKEIIKLIDLLGLRRKVDKVVGTTEENFIDRMKSEKIRANERKELIKEELYNKEIKRDSQKRSEYEPSGFLERYSETSIIINENKYQKNPNKKIKVDVSSEDKQTAPLNAKADSSKVKKNERKKEKPLILPKTSRQEDINEQYEILDTDELTSKIKEYDTKIEKLNKMIKDMETIDLSKEKTDIEEFDNYLQGSKIKVVNIEPARKSSSKDINQKNKKETPKEVITDYDLEFTDLIPIDNIREKIKRPQSEDIKDLRKKESSSKKKSKSTLNLKPNEVKKINRSKKKKEPTTEKNKLNLNPKEIKKINRHPATSNKKNKKTKITKEEPKKNKKEKKSLIVIEKIK